MGTIEDKLKYLAKTKVDLMNALKAKGAPIDESTPLSEYDVMVKAIKGGAATEVFNSIEEMEAATLSPGTICKIVKEGIIKQPLTEATSIKSILLNNVIEMAKSSTNSTKTRWESADGTEYFEIYKASGLTGMLYPNRKMIKYYSAVESGGFEIYYDHNGEAYTTSSLNEPYLIEFSNPLTLVTDINHSDISALIYSTIPTEVLTNIFEFKDDEYIELIGTPKPYESIEDMEADAITPEITAVVYDKSSDTFMGIYEATEFGWKILSGQLTATANTIAPGFIGYGPDGIVNGTFTTDATASASDILEGQTAYVNGEKVIGNIQSTYITTDGVASPLYENSWTGNTSYRTMAFSHKFGVALIRTTTTKKTESLRIAKVNKETGAYSMLSSSYDITNSQLVESTSHSFVGADIAHQLNEDGTLRMAFVLSTLSTTTYNRDGYIVACDYDLNTNTIKKIYKPSFGLVDLDNDDRDVNGTPVIFSPTNKDVFLVVDVISNSTSSSGTYDIPGWLTNYALALCFIQPSGDILLRSCLKDGNVSAYVKSQRIAWSPDGTRIWWNASGLYPNTYKSRSSSICKVNYESASVTTTKFKNAGHGHMVFLNENTLFELKYNKTYNIYSTDGVSLTKIKSGTINMNIYYKTDTSYSDANITELRCVDNNIFYVDSQNFYCITLDDEYNISRVQALDSKYCCLFDVQESSPYLNRKCLVTKVEDGKYIHCSDANQYYAVFEITGDKVIETINKDGVTLHNTSSANATSSNILINKSAYVNGGKVLGGMPNNGELTYMPTIMSQEIPMGYIQRGAVAGDINLVPENISANKNIFGVAGSAPAIFSSRSEMEANLSVPNKTFGIVYENNSFKGIYRFINGSWIDYGIPSEGVLIMDVLNDTLGTEDEYSGFGGTEEEINTVLDTIMNGELNGDIID